MQNGIFYFSRNFFNFFAPISIKKKKKNYLEVQIQKKNFFRIKKKVTFFFKKFWFLLLKI